jgi:hypothetical protein
MQRIVMCWHAWLWMRDVVLRLHRSVLLAVDGACVHRYVLMPKNAVRERPGGGKCCAGSRRWNACFKVTVKSYNFARLTAEPG